MQGLQQIYEFMQEWREIENFHVLPNGNLQFSALITYSSPKYGTQTTASLIMVDRTGKSDGNINILDNGPLNSDTHHLGFSERFQSYEFDKSTGALVISGDSPKMGGKYKVMLKPDGKEVNWKPS